jgi:hypothetical protein
MNSEQYHCIQCQKWINPYNIVDLFSNWALPPINETEFKLINAAPTAKKLLSIPFIDWLYGSTIGHSETFRCWLELCLSNSTAECEAKVNECIRGVARGVLRVFEYRPKKSWLRH